MSVTSVASGSILTDGTEQTLASIEVPGVYTFHVDMTPRSSYVDTLYLRIYSMLLAGGTAGLTYYAAYAGNLSPTDVVSVSPPIPNDLFETDALLFTLEMFSGGPYTFDWKVLRL